MRLPVFITACALFLGGSWAHGQEITFRHDVMAVLSKAGCNQGPCHGNQNGKGGFKLSLRGEDPEWDFSVLTRDTFARRTDPLRPDQSLILLKATSAVPHEGGTRFTSRSPEYAIFRGWIAAGLTTDPPTMPRLTGLSVRPQEQVLLDPADRVQVQVQASFSDGSVRDVSRLAVYEPVTGNVHVSAGGEVRREQMGEATVLVRYLDRQAPVRLAFVPARPGYKWPDTPENSYVDRYVFAKLRSLRMLPSDLAPDHVFLRRAHLDAIGVLPTASEARAFLADTRPDKRSLLIDGLLKRPEFADFWALKWSDLLRNEEKVLDRKGVQLFHQWLRQAILEGRPLNELARELVAGRGSTYSSPEANFYRALRDPYARAEATAQVFLGIRLQCARCHNHPFDRWTQHDYHSLAAFFARVQYRIVENNRRDRLDKHEFDGEQVVWMDRESEVKHPRSGEALPPLFPGARTPDLREADRLQALADWIAAPDNTLFARAQANRIWFHLMGRGLVEPNDDFRASNPPSNAPLLEALARDLVAHRYDLRQFVRTIMQSRTYQLSAVPNETNRDDEANFARALVRPLQAEQLLDALSHVTGVPAEFNGYRLGQRAGQLSGVRADHQRRQAATDGERFLTVFGKPERSLTCECERSEDVTLAQAFQLISGGMVNTMLTSPDNRIGKLLAVGRSDHELLEEVYLAAVCRPPTEKEWEAALAYLKKAKVRRAGWEDLLWGLVNAKEFLLRQ